MHRSLAVAIVLGGLAASSVARADPSVSDRFVRGTSPGELPTGKLVTIGSLYTLSAASLGLGVVSLFSASDKAKQADAFKLTQPRGFCRDLSSEACVSYHSLESDATNTRTLGGRLSTIATARAHRADDGPSPDGRQLHLPVDDD